MNSPTVTRDVYAQLNNTMLSEIIAKYRDKLKLMEAEIESIMKEEEAEKGLVRAEIEANKAIKMIQDKKTKRKKKRGQPDPADKSRVWFQSTKDRKDGK
jgi:hypothetical protein